MQNRRALLRPFDRFVVLASLTSVAFGLRAPLASAQAASQPQAAAPRTLTLAETIVDLGEGSCAHGARGVRARRFGRSGASTARTRSISSYTVSIQGAGTAFTTNGQIYSGGLVSTASTDTYLLAQGTLNLQWTLYDFGRHVESTIDSAKAGVTAAGLSARASEQRAMAEAAVAFFTLLADDARWSSRRTRCGPIANGSSASRTASCSRGSGRRWTDNARPSGPGGGAARRASVAEAARDNDQVILASALMLLDPATTFHLQALCAARRSTRPRPTET